jgi:O-antigen ligase
MLVGHGPREKFLPKPLRSAATTWALFVLATLLSLRNADNPLGDSKWVIDTFALPGLLAYFVIGYFPVRRWLATLHVLTCLMVIYSAAIGVAELFTGEDLLPIPGGTVILEETGTFQRANGPFAGNHILGLVGLTALWFLLFARRALRDQVKGWWLALHMIGLASAFAMVVMPMFRSIVITFLAALFIELYWNKRPVVRFAAVMVILLAVLGLFALRSAAPRFFEGRVSDASDLYARIAQQEQTLHMFIEHPLNGVGMGNYNRVASELPVAQFQGVESVAWPHNNWAAVLAETGLMGLIPYVLAQVFLFQAFWKLRKRQHPEVILASNCFLYVFLAYGVNGLMLTSGYDSDLNYWYLFVIGVLYKFAATADSHSRAEPSLANHVFSRTQDLLNVRS